MQDTIKEAIKTKLLELYPDYTVYDEDLPGEYQKPSFLIQVKSQTYTSLLQGNYKNQMMLDISYYSNVSETINGDCLRVSNSLLIGFDSVNHCQIRNKKAETIEKVLHFTFEIQYSVRKEEEFIKMQKQEVNTKL
ncbi:hypothetical protein QA584_27380 [Anaerocolumna sp. AGMB13025]|uniref:phage tail terminator family protein n=1 Tax=Anaerocolumna sp. AGMB13025 TaxID=3039116 RepID=UPI00241C1BAC|nr:hypothetical protein [Anaerocolumna sp. AGMB13025]WFR57283.1 hypothetical protein QA584_27380 [Anaerocolumna sp. AGMB13025]